MKPITVSIIFERNNRYHDIFSATYEMTPQDIYKRTGEIIRQKERDGYRFITAAMCGAAMPYEILKYGDFDYETQ